MRDAEVRLADLRSFVLGVLIEMRHVAESTPELKSRELSLALTKLEEGEHWLIALAARLASGPDLPVPKGPAG